jgi:hypothetical protein
MVFARAFFSHIFRREAKFSSVLGERGEEKQKHHTSPPSLPAPFLVEKGNFLQLCVAQRASHRRGKH